MDNNSYYKFQIIWKYWAYNSFFAWYLLPMVLVVPAIGKATPWRSIVNKAPILHRIICERDLDLVAVTETWIPQDCPDAISNDVSPPGYAVIHRCRGEGGAGGGRVFLLHWLWARGTCRILLFDCMLQSACQRAWWMIRIRVGDVVGELGSVDVAFLRDVSHKDVKQQWW